MESDHGWSERIPETTIPDHRCHCGNHRPRYPRSLQRHLHLELWRRNRFQLPSRSDLFSFSSLHSNVFCHERKRAVDGSCGKINLSRLEGSHARGRSPWTCRNQHEPPRSLDPLRRLPRSGCPGRLWIRSLTSCIVRPAGWWNIHKVSRCRRRPCW